MNCQGGSARIVLKRPSTFATRSSAGGVSVRLTIFDIKLFRDSKYQDWAPARAAAFELRKELAHVRGRHSERSSAAQALDDFLKLVAPRDNHTDRQHSDRMQQAKVVQVAVEERVFVVPFDLESHPVSIAVN